MKVLPTANGSGTGVVFVGLNVGSVGYSKRFCG